TCTRSLGRSLSMRNLEKLALLRIFQERGDSSGLSIGGWTFVLSWCALTLLVPGGPAFRDAGELGAAAQVLGVPHPTGFPNDMLLLRAGTLLPFGPLAFRQNLVIGTLAAMVLAMIAKIVGQLCDGIGIGGLAAWVGVAVGCLGLACWSTFLASA